MSDELGLEVDLERGCFRDVHGRRVLLRGANVGGRAKRAPFLPLELPPVFDVQDVLAGARELLSHLPRWGLDTVRLTFSWEGIEPARGAYDEVYFSYLAAVLDVAFELRLRVVLDFHQDIYATPLGGDGMPAWTLPPAYRDVMTEDRRNWYMAYLCDPRVVESFSRFWRNEDALLDALAAMWIEVIRRFGNHPAVIGYEIMNEPGWGELDPLLFEKEVWLPLCERIGGMIARTHPHLILFYGVPGVHALEPWRHDRFPRLSQVCFAPHLYDPGLLLAPRGGAVSSPERALAKLAALSREAGLPVFIGEFGCTHGAVGAEQWFDEMFSGMDRYGISGTLWELSQGESRWNFEDLDLLSPNGSPRPVVRAIARPRIAALAGELDEIRWDAPRRQFLVRWYAEGSASTRIALPGSLGFDALEGLSVFGEDVELALEALNVLSVSAPEHECVEIAFSLPAMF